jgi:hypothetical protein
VRSLKKSTVAGLDKLTPGPTDYTDDRGIYRLNMLEPGEYVVAVPMTQSMGLRDIEMLAAGGVAFTASVNATAVDSLLTTLGRGGSAAGLGPDGRPLAYLTQFYPATSDSTRATLIRLQSGEERPGIDFQLRPTPTRRITGRVMGPEGPMPRTMLTLLPADTDGLASPIESTTTSTDPAGEFVFDQVPPGAYTVEVVSGPRMGVREAPIAMAGGGGAVMVRQVTVMNAAAPPAPTDPTLWAALPVTVGSEDVSDAIVVLRPGPRLRGQVEFSGNATKPAPDALTSISVFLEPASGRGRTPIPLRGRVESSGTFASPSVPPGKYLLRVGGAPQGWNFRGAFHGGHDIADEPIELGGTDISGIVLRFTDQTTELSGSVTAAGGQRDEAATVIVFPTDRGAWTNYGTSPRRLRSVRVDKNGGYSLSGLPPGEYFVTAVPEVTASDWQTLAALESLAQRARRVQIGEGQKVAQPLEVIR